MKMVELGWEGGTEECGQETQEHPMGQAREEGSRGQNSFMEGGLCLV